MKESDLTNKIIKAIRARGGFWFKVHGSAYQMAGVPDILGCYRGHFIGIEVKLPGLRHKVSKRQRLILSRIRRAKGTAAVCTSTEAALDVLDRLDAAFDSARGDSTPQGEGSTDEPE